MSLTNIIFRQQNMYIYSMSLTNIIFRQQNMYIYSMSLTNIILARSIIRLSRPPNFKLLPCYY